MPTIELWWLPNDRRRCFQIEARGNRNSARAYVIRILNDEINVAPGGFVQLLGTIGNMNSVASRLTGGDA